MHKELKRYFSASVIIFIIYFVSFALSFILADKFTIIGQKPITELYILQDAKPIIIFISILLTNLAGALIMAALGIFFGISAIAYTISSGLIFGAAFFKTFESTGLANSVAAYAPHAIFEIPALIISMAIGLSLGNLVIKSYDKKYKNNKLMNTIKIIILALGAMAFLVPSNYFMGNPRIIKALLLVPLFWLMAKVARETELFGSKEWKQAVKNRIKTFIKIVIPLYIIAALIEIR